MAQPETQTPPGTQAVAPYPIKAHHLVRATPTWTNQS